MFLAFRRFCLSVSLSSLGLGRSVNLDLFRFYDPGVARFLVLGSGVDVEVPEAPADLAVLKHLVLLPFHFLI